jgi:iron complex transport system substrate-binding protein
MRRSTGLALIPILLLSSLSGGFCFPIKATDDLRRETELLNPPQRIISLGPAITEELYLLGVEDRLVANTIYCQSPPEAKEKQKIGTVIKVDVEKIVSLKPDLVLATSLTDSKQVEKLRSLGIKVTELSQTQDFSQICQIFLQLGELVSEQEKARDIVRRATEQIERVRTVIERLPKPNVFMQVGANPLFTVIENSFINELIELAGGINIARGTTSGLYSREKVIRQNPDIILIVTMGVVGEQEKEMWQRFKTMNAVKNNNIHIVDSDKVCSPTPLSFVETLEEFADIFHPEITGKIAPNTPPRE